MNLALFLTNRIVFNQQKGFSRFIVIISLIATILSVATMIIASSMVKGFRYEIANKIYGFWGHIEIRSFETFNGYDDEPIDRDIQLEESIKALPGVQNLVRFALKPCILKTENEIESLVLKGVDEKSSEVFSFSIIEGTYRTAQDTTNVNYIVLSEITAKRLGLKVGDKLTVYFASQINESTQLLVRNCVISGLYKSGLSDFDKIYALCSLNLIQKVNKWSTSKQTGYEVLLKQGTTDSKIKSTAQYINENILSSYLSAKSLSELYPNLFDWLELQKGNETIIIILMTIVAIVNLSTMLLILILERSRFIGIMKAIGARTKFITKLFVIQATYIVAFGIVIGNAVGIGICLLEKYLQFIRLDEETYFVSYAPIHFDWLYIILISVSMFIVSIATLLIPTFIISNIQPSKVLRFS